jgi:hypothetical protein
VRLYVVTKACTFQAGSLLRLEDAAPAAPSVLLPAVVAAVDVAVAALTEVLPLGGGGGGPLRARPSRGLSAALLVLAMGSAADGGGGGGGPLRSAIRPAG